MSREQQERERQKALLLRLIQQQRLDLSASHRHWLEATAPIDRGWNTLLNLRSWAMVGSGLVAIWSVRHPRFLMRWATQPRYLEHLADGPQSAAPVVITLRLVFIAE